MGRIARVLSFARDIVNGARVARATINPGGGANVTAAHFAPPGDDSHPLAGDYCVTVESQRTGGAVSVGYVDPVNTPKAGPGDKRIYARDSSGAVVAEVWLQSDGSINLNGVIIDSSGNITFPGSIMSGVADLATHTHTQAPDSDGDIQTPTGPPV